MTQEKQMSAAQPLVFLPRPLYHKENVKKPLFSMFLLKYISPASRFICKSQLFHSHQIWHMLITYSSHTHPEDN
jgi:predicted membrane channel-forming protein YqfA (hemolysin III family)